MKELRGWQYSKLTMKLFTFVNMNAFVVSARKYRPATFDTVVGQAHITRVYQSISIYEYSGLQRHTRALSTHWIKCNEAYCAPFISAKCLFKGILFSQIHSTRPRLSGIKVMQAISSKLSRQSLDKFIVNNEKFNSYSGTDVTKFLQGVCTNDVNKLKNHGDCIAAAFLTPKVKLGLIVYIKLRKGTPL